MLRIPVPARRTRRELVALGATLAALAAAGCGLRAAVSQGSKAPSTTANFSTAGPDVSAYSTPTGSAGTNGTDHASGQASRDDIIRYADRIEGYAEGLDSDVSVVRQACDRATSACAGALRTLGTDVQRDLGELQSSAPAPPLDGINAEYVSGLQECADAIRRAGDAIESGDAGGLASARSRLVDAQAVLADADRQLARLARAAAR